MIWMCGFECSKCTFPDCRCNEKPTLDELKASKELDAAIDYEERIRQASMVHLSSLSITIQKKVKQGFKNTTIQKKAEIMKEERLKESE